MRDWRLEAASQAGMADLLVQNLLLEGTIIALEEAMQAADRLYDCLAHVRQETLDRECELGRERHETEQKVEDR